jgi:hypothetical protein
MPHPLIEPLLTISPLLIALCNDTAIEQTLDRRCKDYKDCLLQFREALNKHFISQDEAFLFDIALQGLKINETIYTLSGKQHKVAESIRAQQMLLHSSTKPTVHSDMSKKQAVPTLKSIPQMTLPTEYNIFIVVHGLLQGNVTLLDEFLNNNPRLSKFLETNMSFLIESFYVWDPINFDSSFKKISLATNTNHWLTTLTLAVNEVDTLIWYYKHSKLAEEYYKSTGTIIQSSEEDTSESATGEVFHTVFPFLKNQHLAATTMQIDCLKYGCYLLARCFPIKSIWAVDRLIDELNQLSHMSNDHQEKLWQFILFLSKLPDCTAKMNYMTQLMKIYNKLNSASIVPATQKRQLSSSVINDDIESVSDPDRVNSGDEAETTVKLPGKERQGNAVSSSTLRLSRGKRTLEFTTVEEARREAENRKPCDKQSKVERTPAALTGAGRNKRVSLKRTRRCDDVTEYNAVNKQRVSKRSTPPESVDEFVKPPVRPPF